MKRLLRILSISIAAIVLPVVLVVVAVLSFEFAIPLDADRERIGEALSDALGRPVTLSGSLRAYTGPRAGFEAAGVRIGANSAAPEGLSIDIGRLVLRVHLIPLLSRTIRVSMLSAEDVLLCAAARSDRAAPPRKTKEPGQGPKWRLNAVDQLKLERIRFARSTPCNATEPVAELVLLEGAAPQDGRVMLSTRARIGDENMAVRLQGPSLAAMLDRRPVQEAFELAAEIAGAKAVAKGLFNFADLSGEGDVEFETAQFARIIRPLGAPFRDFGPLRLRAHVSASRNEAKLRLDEGTLTPGTVTGEMTFAWSGAQPSLVVDARTSRLDTKALDDWLKQSIDVTRVKPGRLTRSTIAGLRASDGRLTIAIGTLVTGPLSLSGVKLDGAWNRGETSASANASLAKAPVAATLRADLRRDELAFSGTAGIRDLVLPQHLPVTGNVKTIEAKFETRGTVDAGLGQGLRATATARQAALSVSADEGKSLPLKLDQLVAQWRERDTLTLDGKGTLSGEPLQARLEGADATALWQRRPWRLRATAAAGPLQVHAKGHVALLEHHIATELDLTARAQRLGLLAHGNAGLAKLPLEAGGNISIKPDAWAVKLANLRLGNSRGRATASGSVPLAARPMKVDLAVDTLDINELAGPRSGGAKDGDLLPQKLALPAADLAARATRVVLPGLVAENVAIEAVTRNGALAIPRFEARLDGAGINGRLELDLTGPIAKVSANVKASRVTEALFGKQRADEGLRLQLGEVALAAASNGNRVRDLAGNATIDIALRDGTLSFPVGTKKTRRTGTVATARLSASPDQPVLVTLAGELEKLPVDLKASSAPLARLLQPADAPIAITGRIAGIAVELAGNLPGPRLPENPLTVKVRAEKLSQLGEITDHDLPATGPFTIDVTLRGLSGPEPSADADVGLGESRLSGKLTRRATSGRSSWNAALKGARLRLEDLGSADWMATQEKSKPAAKRAAGPAQAGTAGRKQRAQLLYDELRNALRRFDLQLRATIDSVSSGTQNFGRLDANLTLDSGRLRVAPVAFTGSAAGKLTVSADADYALDDSPFRLDIDLENFRYGRLVNSINPKLDATGALSARLHVTGRGKPGEVAQNLNGRAGLILFPSSGRGLKLLERWGGGLVRNIGLSLDTAKDSRVNCGVATFDVSRGNVTSRALMIDSTRVRAAGEVKLDLATGALEGLIMPKTKRAELFSAKTPVTISGTLDAPKVAVATTSVLVTAARYYYFAYAFLFDAASGGDLAADGSPDCIAAYERLSKTPAPPKAATDKGP